MRRPNSDILIYSISLPIFLALWWLEKQKLYKYNSCEIQQSLGGGMGGKMGLELPKKHHL